VHCEREVEFRVLGEALKCRESERRRGMPLRGTSLAGSVYSGGLWPAGLLRLGSAEPDGSRGMVVARPSEK
jgi:hypothetical protein